MDVARDAGYAAQAITLGGRVVRNEFVVRLSGAGAECSLSGGALAHARRHVDHTTEITHAAPHTESEQIFRNVADDNARTVFQGRVVVERDAQKTNARQSSRSLLLSAGAEAQNKPELRIFADDVNAATADRGDLDKDALFYLRTRGIDEAEARALLTRAFVADLSTSLPVASLRPAVEAAVDDWLRRKANGAVEMTAVNGAYDVDAVRRDFPILGESVYGKTLVYLDNGASAQKPRAVIGSLAHVYEAEYANVHRGVHYMSQKATEAMEAAREKARSLINAEHAHETIFVRGATEGINLVASSWGRANLAAGDEIVLSVMEHHSNIVPWQIVAEQTGAAIRVAPISDEGVLDMDALEALIGPRTRMVAITHVSNALGTVVPVADVIRLARRVGALVLLDGCQAVPHMAVDVRALDADFYVFSGHKLYGPSGIGVLYGKEELLEAMPPYRAAAK